MRDSKFIGDLLLTFGDGASLPASRVSADPWVEIRPGDGTQLWASPAASLWKGFPYQFVESPGWQFYILGEFYSLTDKFIPERIPALNGRFLILGREQKSQSWQ